MFEAAFKDGITTADQNHEDTWERKLQKVRDVDSLLAEVAENNFEIAASSSAGKKFNRWIDK
eukprot:9491367-Pyramimonas_sp.AAC.1